MSDTAGESELRLTAAIARHEKGLPPEKPPEKGFYGNVAYIPTPRAAAPSAAGGFGGAAAEKARARKEKEAAEKAEAEAKAKALAAGMEGVS